MPAEEHPRAPWTTAGGEPGPRRLGPPAQAILWVPVVVSFVVQVPATVAVGVWTHTRAGPILLSVLLALAGCAALLGARRWPGPTVAAVAGLAVASLFVPPHGGPPFLALAFAIVGAIARGARRWAIAATATGWLAAVVLGSLAGLQWHPFRIAATTAALILCFVIGEAVRTRTERATAQRARQFARRASAEQAERTRIARELHDVLAHSLSQISVQSGMALHLFDREPERAREALVSIRALSGAGLDEVRGVLGFLRGDERAPVTPQPQLADLPALAQARSGLGLIVELRELPPGDTPSGDVQTTAYRIVQEALTNVVRHSGATHAWVTLERAGTGLRVVVDDDGAGIRHLGTDSARVAGGGMRGMRERVALAGGTLEVGPRPGGGTRVAAHLPMEAP